ncbi:hypothetical protein [Parahalioglobus pacificus]|uniref:Uncharacterized protein n=1 Tax=Parahalioglobus pacificus TaxID=930806 RepID=A0A919CJW5_9GAMM|nr:hypothetical protein [Halioglobus pacificus]GHD32075.1 hypothetical protein GCM10007053_15790 [Halioglobus pacificus]
MQHSDVAGALLIAGGLTILTTIAFEYQVGWIGVARTREETINFVLSEWSTLKKIWSFQMLGHGFLALACLIQLREAPPHQALIWGALSLLTLMVIIAFGLTVGGYGPALEANSAQPAVFETLRGAVRGLYSPGMYGGMALFTSLFVLLSVRKFGIVGRLRGATTLGAVAICLLIGITTPLTAKVAGASWFLLPVVLGYSLLRPRRP